MYWLKNDHLEAGFTWKKGIRLADLRVPGGENLLRETDDPYHGLKTWVMAPSDIIALRDMLSGQPASMEFVSEREIRLKTLNPNEWGLVLEWVVTLEEDRPAITILQRIHNEGEVHRYVGIWSLAAFPADCVFRIPFARSPHVPRDFPNNIAVFPWTDIGDTRISSTREYLQLEIREGQEDGNVKLGLVQPQGRIDVLKQGIVLEFTAPYDPDAEYPEGGSNVTIYASPANRPTTMGEVEHMGPLEVLAPGKAMELPVRMTLEM
ncbi:MAG: hypothetical protein ACP5I4_00635 [Oceanipulchritudo sp.]